MRARGQPAFGTERRGDRSKFEQSNAMILVANTHKITLTLGGRSVIMEFDNGELVMVHRQSKVQCEVCGNCDWWKFDLREGIHVCLCCEGKKEYDKRELKDGSPGTRTKS